MTRQRGANARQRQGLTRPETDQGASRTEASGLLDAVVAGQGPFGLMLDEAFADVKVGRKLWRQLRAELRLQDESLGAACVTWRMDEGRARRALSKLFPPDAAETVADRLAVAAETLEAHAAARKGFRPPNSASPDGAGTIAAPTVATVDCPQPVTTAATHSRWARHKRPACILAIPDAQLQHLLSFCATLRALCAASVASTAFSKLATADMLWTTVWQNYSGCLMGPQPTSGVREKMLQSLATRCVECRKPTEFEHVLIGCRLCQSCERSLAKYTLIGVKAASRYYQLAPARLRESLPSFDGVTGRVYLRSAVERFAAQMHSDSGLRQLRAKHVKGTAKEGRQGHVKSRCCSDDMEEDEGCFDATALQRAAIAGKK
eukprot:gnl/TRDRNA2_/TRDRNA2_45013_c0_seq1.p1 gnl/TRDRNA2_/TRDRNA2_45013_c0~~gnl/TRDRNA2_/TRDRNA2_45013_c0_seq1.p1  ORF type:complete len:407 (+),score=40.45 gnl/TRDRNA2_/TRDRNA2_45013_c0_seq1:91-1221(+)